MGVLVMLGVIVGVGVAVGVCVDVCVGEAVGVGVTTVGVFDPVGLTRKAERRILFDGINNTIPAANTMRIRAMSTKARGRTRSRFDGVGFVLCFKDPVPSPAQPVP